MAGASQSVYVCAKSSGAAVEVIECCAGEFFMRFRSTNARDKFDKFQHGPPTERINFSPLR
jgi:hypothetical protein